MEVFATPCVGAIIERIVDGVPCILIQIRQKSDGGDTNGKLEIPSGKVRAYECVYDALRREVMEETGMRVTEIVGEHQRKDVEVAGNHTVSFVPCCTTQNLCGAYSILLHTFVCRAEGEPLVATDEAQNIGWMPIDAVRERLSAHPEDFFFMHICALRAYLGML
ncbi:MAG: NUDIX domain-containing protein [Clostridia bacterium]|nr:NUDIX domain-containing protein [Clostridia bacterium]